MRLGLDAVFEMAANGQQDSVQDIAVYGHSYTELSTRWGGIAVGNCIDCIESRIHSRPGQLHAPIVVHGQLHFDIIVAIFLGSQSQFLPHEFLYRNSDEGPSWDVRNDKK